MPDKRYQPFQCNVKAVFNLKWLPQAPLSLHEHFKYSKFSSVCYIYDVNSYTQKGRLHAEMGPWPTNTFCLYICKTS